MPCRIRETRQNGAVVHSHATLSHQQIQTVFLSRLLETNHFRFWIFFRFGDIYICIMSYSGTGSRSKHSIHFHFTTLYTHSLTVILYIFTVHLHSACDTPESQVWKSPLGVPRGAHAVLDSRACLDYDIQPTLLLEFSV